MKFGKSYMETLASPSFPKEWREGAIEYKQLKKLINGVVAELESLGLGADVLRDLIVPPDNEDDDGDGDGDGGEKNNQSRHNSESEQDDFGIDDDEDLIEDLEIQDEQADENELASSSRPKHPGRHSTSRRTRLPLHLHSAMHRSFSSPTGGAAAGSDPSMGSSADDCDQCASDLQRHKAERANHPESPAAEWVAHIAHAQHTHRQKRRSSKRGKRPSTAQEFVLQTESSDQDAHSASAAGGGTSSDEKRKGRRIEYLRPPALRNAVSEARSFSESAVAPGDGADLSESARLNKRDLEALRLRRASSADTSHKISRSSSASTNASKISSNDRVHDWGGLAWRERAGLRPNTAAASQQGSRANVTHANGKGRERDGKFAQPKWVQGKDGRRARAEYELGGTAERPIPHIRLYVESPIQSGDELSDGDEADSEGEEDDDENDDDDGVLDQNEDAKEDNDEARFTELGNITPRASIDHGIKPLQGQPRSPILRPDPATNKGEKRRMRTREIVIPLNADTEFLDTLTGALSNLSTLQETQREQFKESTDALCKAVSDVASPYGNKNDLYAWREIFGLWTELQIFESQREKDRGELSVDETELRLKKFSEELAKRGWNTEAFAQDAKLRAEAAAAASAKGKDKKLGGKLAKWRHHASGGTAVTGALPMKDPRSLAALEDFLKLNLALLDVKKFQRVNVEAARKILKKHDKRTALTASSDLGAFVEQQERMRSTAASAAAGIGISGLVTMPAGRNISTNNSSLVRSHGAATHPSLAALLPSSTSALLSSSLPHILLSLMTTTLLPILPAIDDYSCAICTGVAWRPIKLDCAHLFCIRCLVKLQKQGKNDCPLCRAAGVVGNADERNLDKDSIEFLRRWFPREVAEKDKENEKDRHKEEMLELGFALDNEKCTIA